LRTANKKRALAIVAVVTIPILYTLLFVEPLSRGRQNQVRLVKLLTKTKLIWTGCCVTAVILRDGQTLKPDQPKVVSGYRLSLGVSGVNFIVEAVPVQYGSTGYVSYRLHQTGVLQEIPPTR
jgi:hypothetical protein